MTINRVIVVIHTNLDILGACPLLQVAVDNSIVELWEFCRGSVCFLIVSKVCVCVYQEMVYQYTEYQ